MPAPRALAGIMVNGHYIMIVPYQYDGVVGYKFARIGSKSG